jgi:hypothetical protein
MIYLSLKGCNSNIFGGYSGTISRLLETTMAAAFIAVVIVSAVVRDSALKRT